MARIIRREQWDSSIIYPNLPAPSKPARKGRPIKAPASVLALTVPQLRAVAKSWGLRGYSKLRKADLVALLSRSEIRATA